MASITKFYENLNAKVEQAFLDIDATKNTLHTEIQHIGELKVKTKETQAFINVDDIPDLRDVVIQSIEELIQKCLEYRTRHINKTDLL